LLNAGEEDPLPSLSSISFDDSGLTSRGEVDGKRIWVTPSGDGVALHYFPIPPDIAADPHDLAGIRQYYRETAARVGGAIIEVDTLKIDDCLAIRLIVKVPQVPHGMTYLGSITLPYRLFSFVLKIQCPEYGITGIRATLVGNELMREGLVRLDRERDEAVGWAQDPYDPSLTSGLRRNHSESEAYDSRFPDDPLSRLRTLLNRLQGTIRLANDLHEQPLFVFPPVSHRSRWWLW
jgi:hypothetical protein